jgi:hypothetical protein
MEGIYQATHAFEFNKITMISPTMIAGGNYFIKFRMNDIPLYIQTPKCKLKQGVLKSGKRLYCDLMFTSENEEFICWMENLENYCQKKIYENREKWFETPLDEHDIENSFTSPLKLYKSGKFYISRTNVPSLLGNCSLKIYNENEELVPSENIQENMDVITILEIQGIKCSIRNFQIEIEIKQMMVMNPINLFEKCLLKKSINSAVPSIPQIESFTHAECNQTDTVPILTTPIESDNIFLEPNQELLTYSVPSENQNNDVSINTEMLEENISIIKNTTVPESSNIPSEITNEINNTTLQNGIVADTNVDTDSDNDNGSDDSVYDDDYEYKRDKIVIQEDNNLMEIELDLDDLQDLDPPVHIKNRNDIYLNMYKEAKSKAKMARDLAIASYLEAKNIKNTYMVVDDDDSDLEEESFQHFESRV